MELTHLIELMTGFITILVLDFKGDFGDIPDLLGRDRWLRFDASEGFRLVWNPPHKCRDYNGWINNITKVICAHCDLKFSEAVLANVFRIAFNILNNPVTNPVNFPSPLLIEQLMDYLPARMITTKHIYLESALHKIRFLRRIGGGLLEAERGFDIFEHLIDRKKCAVINCTGLHPILKGLVVNILSLQFNFTSISLNELSQQTKYVLIVDEGDEISSKEASAKYPEGYSEYAKGFKQDRAFGGMKILGLSSYAKCDLIIKANTTNYFLFPPADSDSTYEASKTLLEPDSKPLIGSLKRGQAIFKEVMGLVPYGMLIETDHVPPSEKAYPEKYDQHPFTEARGINDIPGFRDELDKQIQEYKATQFRQSKRKNSQAQKLAPKLSKNERAFLDHLSLKEYEPVHIIFSRIGDISDGVQQQTIKKLQKMALIETTPKIRTGRIFVRFVSFTDEGRKYMNK